MLWPSGFFSIFSVAIMRAWYDINQRQGPVPGEDQVKFSIWICHPWKSWYCIYSNGWKWLPWISPLRLKGGTWKSIGNSGILAEHDDVAQFLIISLGGVPRLANKWNCTKLYWLFSSRSVFTTTFGRAHVTLSGQTIIQLLLLGRMGGFPSLKPEVLVLIGKSTTIPDSQGLLHCNLKSDDCSLPCPNKMAGQWFR